MQGAETRARLEAAVVRVAPDPDVKPQAVSNVTWAFATLGWEPGAEVRAALEIAVVRVGPDMTPQEVSNTLWSVLSLAATRAVPLPACYPSLWVRRAFVQSCRNFNAVSRVPDTHRAGRRSRAG